MTNSITCKGEKTITSADQLHVLVPDALGVKAIGFFKDGEAMVEMSDEVLLARDEDMPLLDWAEELGIEVQDGVYVASVHTQRGLSWCVVQKKAKEVLVGGIENLSIGQG